MNKERNEDKELEFKIEDFNTWKSTIKKNEIKGEKNDLIKINNNENKSLDKADYYLNYFKNFLNLNSENNENNKRKENINENIIFKEPSKTEYSNSKENGLKNFPEVKIFNGSEDKNKFKNEEDKEFLNKKTYRDIKLDMFMKKIENKEIKEIKQKNEKNNKQIKADFFWNNIFKKDKKDPVKKIAENKNTFNYNIDKNEVISNHINIFYKHELDNDDELEKIINKNKENFYLCKICNKFFESKYLARKHQWEEHLKPYNLVIRKNLISKKKS